MVPIRTGLFSGEKVISGMSLGRKNSMYGSFKGARERNFVGFMQLSNYIVCARPQTSNGHNFLVQVLF